MNKPTIVVTGAAGFIGSHACEALLADGWRVVGVDNFCDFYPRSWKEANVKAIGPGIDVTELDITDEAKVSKFIATTKPQAILHLAAMAGVRPSIEQPTLYSRVNVTGTSNLLESARINRVSKFIFASSSSVYGNNSRVPFSEDDPVEQPISPYAATKRAGELICYTHWHLYKMPIFCLRFFTVFGPRQRPDLAIHKFTRLILRGEPIPFFGDGSMSRDHTFIEDIIRGVMAAVQRCDRYRIYNLGGSHPVLLKQLVEEIEKAVGKSAIIDRKPAQPGDVERTYADVTRAKSELGFEPRVTLSEGLRRFVAWFTQNAAQYALPGE
jgi:UDP-glucuronate 4-epimerase